MTKNDCRDGKRKPLDIALAAPRPIATDRRELEIELLLNPSQRRTDREVERVLGLLDSLDTNGNGGNA